MNNKRVLSYAEYHNESMEAGDVDPAVHCLTYLAKRYELNGLSFRVFPSVTDGIVTVAFPAPLTSMARIEVRDMSGRLVTTNNLGEGMTQIQVDLNNQTDGFYVIRVTAGLQVATEVVVKQH